MMYRFVCFGEILWDIFPDEERIGGAPLNVALRLNSFGNDVRVISAIGNDQYGKDLLRYMHDHHLDTSTVFQQEHFTTGKVMVSVDETGSAQYEITHPAAWDKIAYTPAMEQIAQQSDCFIFGTLACRDKHSCSTLLRLLPVARYKVMDVNLRPPHYAVPLIIQLMEQADFIKLNDDELYEIAASLHSPYQQFEQNIKYLSEKTHTNRICVTKGKHGAVLFYDQKWYYNSGYHVRVMDTVGAGDSFLATLLHFLAEHKDPQEAMDYACAVGAIVASEKGANPTISMERVRHQLGH